MDIPEVLVAIMAALASFGGSYLANNKNQAVMAEQISRLREDVAKLSDRVDKHNSLSERLKVLEVQRLEVKADIDGCHNAIRELKAKKT